METIDLTPNWDGMRRWVLHVFRTDPSTARRIAADMGSEAPTFPGDDCTCPDDCNCRRPWRINYCGCKAHDSTAINAEDSDPTHIDKRAQEPTS